MKVIKPSITERIKPSNHKPIKKVKVVTKAEIEAVEKEAVKKFAKRIKK